MEAIPAYIARDRHEAIAGGRELPARAHGAALFADISGFTPLTEALAKAWGPRRGAEELTVHLNRVYDALVGEVHGQGGSIISFAGDAITCWFDGDDGRRAAASGLAMQAAMARQPAVQVGESGTVVLSLKVGMAVGEVMRVAVGNPAIQRLDVLAGETLGRMANAANAAGKGEVVVAGPVGWAMEEEVEMGAPGRPGVVGSGHGMVSVRGLRGEWGAWVWPPRPVVSDDLLRPWILPAIFERLKGGRGEFLTELRPAVALFLKFASLDYDHDPEAGAKLDAFVRWVQRVVSSFGGFVHHVSVGDKGSYLYGTFGAPIAHEDDAARALAAAHELKSPPADLGFAALPQVGISQGTLRTGAYGGMERRTYGVLGDEVNLAARLMEHAKPGEVWVVERTRQEGGEPFAWEAIAPIKLKGKAEPVAAYRLLERRTHDGLRLSEPAHVLPMVGRVAEMQRLGALVDQARSGRGQYVEVRGEAGMGKSRLLEEMIRVGRDKGWQVLGGQAQSFGMDTPYLVWRPIWRAFFQLERSATLEAHAASVAATLLDLNPALLPRLPLLGNVLNLALPDNDTTRLLDAKLRKAALEGLLVECLRLRAERVPLMLIIEDGQWLDALSHDLLVAVGRGLHYQRIVVLVACRPPHASEVEVGQAWPHFTAIHLVELVRSEAEELIRMKLGLAGGAGREPDPGVVRQVYERSQGNPFYLEELIHLVRDRGLDPNDPRSWEAQELPTSLHSLILSRMDRLSERQKPTLKVASVIGRVFEPGTISAIEPSLVEPEVRVDLEELQTLELTAMERPEPDLRFIFRHVVTQEVAYETLPYATRERLHGELGAFLERRHAASLDRQLDLLAFHYDRSGNAAKRQEYLLKAAHAAQARYANASAVSYFRRALPLLSPADRIVPLLGLGRVLEVTGDWPAAAEAYRSAIDLARRSGKRLLEARAGTALGDLHRKQGAYADARRELETARGIFMAEGDRAGVAQTLHYEGSVAAQQGEYDKARGLYEESLATRRLERDLAGIGSLLSNLGIIAWFQGDFAEARRLYDESLAMRRELGDRWAIGNSLNNLGLVVRDLGNVAEARRLLEECLAINREIGDMPSIANALGSLADIALSQGDFDGARAFLVENTLLNRDLGDRNGLAFSLELFAQWYAGRKEAAIALRLAGAAGALREAIGARLSPSEQERLDRTLAESATGLGAAEREVELETGRKLSADGAIAVALGPPSDRP